MVMLLESIGIPAMPEFRSYPSTTLLYRVSATAEPGMQLFRGVPRDTWVALRLQVVTRVNGVVERGIRLRHGITAVDWFSVEQSINATVMQLREGDLTSVKISTDAGAAW